jgi:hypothetical protein
MNRSNLLAIAATATTFLLAGCGDTSSPLTSPAATQSLFAKGAGGGGGGGGGGTVTPGSSCATITVTNNPQSVRHLVMPDIKYDLENCGSTDLSVTVSIQETAGFLSELCPSPLAPPVIIALAPKQKLSETAPVFRGPCGMTGPVNGTLVEGENRWQGHNLLLTLTDNATGVVYGSAPFSWQDVFAAGL